MSTEDKGFYVVTAALGLLVVAIILVGASSYDDGYQRGLREGAALGWNNAEKFYGTAPIKTSSQ